MKIFCLTPWFPCDLNDQQGNYILDSVQAIQDLGYKQTIFVLQPWKPKFSVVGNLILEGVSAKRYNYFSIPRHCLKTISNWFFLNKATKILERAIRKERPDILHSHTEYYAIAIAKLGKKYNIPTVVTIHGQETSHRYWKGCKAKIVSALKMMDRIILVGEPLRPFFKDLMGYDCNFNIIHNGFRFSQKLAEKEMNIWQKPIRIISVSNLHEGKGIDLTLQALVRLKAENNFDWIYTIIGDGREKIFLQKMVNDLGLKKKVKFTGALKHNEVYDYLLQSHIFLLPSYREAFGIAYVEAMAAGLLTIGVEGQGAAAFIKHNETGFLVKPRDINSIMQILKQILNEQEIAQKISTNSKKYAHNHLTWQHHAMAIDKIYKSLDMKK